MITLWVVYCLGVSALLTIAAAACEYVLRGRGVPLRGVWACALAGSLLLPAWSVATSLAVDDVAAASSVPQTAAAPAVVLDDPAPIVNAALVAIPRQTSWAERTLAPARPLLNAASPGVLVVWLVSSFWMAAFLLTGWLRLRTEQSRWRWLQLGDRKVMISDGIGPAVVGFVRPAIVLPEWILQLEQGRRRLVVLHEEEHLRAHDERLLFLASVALIAMPCNVALWYQVRRLRLAVEIDCDARVLRVHPDPREYGDLLLHVGSRVDSGRLQLAALSEPVSFLARRISAMMTSRRQSRPAAMMTLVVALAAATIAWRAPRPPVPAFGATPLPSQPSHALVAAQADSLPTVVWDGERMTRDSLVRRLYGRTLLLSGSGVLEFLIDANDVVRSAGVRSRPTRYRSGDTSVALHGFENRYGGVAPADVASIEIDSTSYGFPEIWSVIWVQLKPGVRADAAGGRARGAGATAAVRARTTNDSERSVSGRATAQARSAKSVAVSADSQARLIEQMASQMARHQTEAARLQAEVTRHAAEAARLSARLSALDTGYGGRGANGRSHAVAVGQSRGRTSGVAGNGVSALSYGGGGRSDASRPRAPSPEAIAAVARRLYPQLFSGPPASPVSVWFLADSSDRVLETRLALEPLGTVGIEQVLNAFPTVTRERVQSWSVTGRSRVGMAWVRIRP